MTDALKTLDPPVVGMLGMFSPTYRCARAAEAAARLTGDDVTIVGFDFEPETLSYMQSGMIKATHAQRQYYMGYIVPYVLYSMKVLGASRDLDILGSAHGRRAPLQRRHRRGQGRPGRRLQRVPRLARHRRV